MDKKKIQRLIQALKTGIKPLESFDELDQGVAALRKRLNKDIQAKTLDEVNGKLEGFKKDLDLAPILQSIEELKSASGGIHQELANNLESKFNEFYPRLENSLRTLETSQSDTNLSKDIEALRGDFGANKGVLEDLMKRGEGSEGKMTSLDKDLRKIILDLELRLVGFGKDGEKNSEDIKKIKEAFALFRTEILSRIASNSGGGNANRNVSIAGNGSVLSKYTDINLKAGTNVTITYSNNETLKTTDITITGNSSGGGITRAINNVAVDTAAGSAPSIDYVYLAAGTLTITLPTAVGNSNLYTIKNTGAGVVTIATTGGEGIDGGTNLIMPVQFTSVDLISNTASWVIT